MGWVKIIAYLIAVFFIINAVIFGMYLFSENPSSEILNAVGYNSGVQREISAGSEVVQFEKNMRFNHNTLSFFINSDCDQSKKMRMMRAFSEVQSQTEIILFRPAEESVADILIGCSEESYETEKNTFISGEGGPTEYFNLTMYPLIKKGKILLYQESSCDYPITELHELFHVFGFDHINKSQYIMYPYIDCKQIINPELINQLKEIYSIEPLPELYFMNVSAVKTDNYLNFSVQINNDGLNDAENVNLNVYADNEKVDNFDLKTIAIGSGQVFYVNNLKLPSSNIKTVKLEIYYSGKEYKKDNNVIELSV